MEGGEGCRDRARMRPAGTLTRSCFWIVGRWLLVTNSHREQECGMIRTVHVFQCGSADLYGITRDQTGANLPTDECRDGWRFIRTLELEEGLPPCGPQLRITATSSARQSPCPS